MKNLERAYLQRLYTEIASRGFDERFLSAFARSFELSETGEEQSIERLRRREQKCDRRCNALLNELTNPSTAEISKARIREQLEEAEGRLRELKAEIAEFRSRRQRPEAMLAKIAHLRDGFDMLLDRSMFRPNTSDEERIAELLGAILVKIEVSDRIDELGYGMVEFQLDLTAGLADIPELRITASDRILLQRDLRAERKDERLAALLQSVKATSCSLDLSSEEVDQLADLGMFSGHFKGATWQDRAAVVDAFVTIGTSPHKVDYSACLTACGGSTSLKPALRELLDRARNGDLRLPNAVRKLRPQIGEMSFDVDRARYLTLRGRLELASHPIVGLSLCDPKLDERNLTDDEWQLIRDEVAHPFSRRYRGAEVTRSHLDAFFHAIRRGIVWRRVRPATTRATVQRLGKQGKVDAVTRLLLVHEGKLAAGAPLPQHSYDWTQKQSGRKASSMEEPAKAVPL